MLRGNWLVIVAIAVLILGVKFALPTVGTVSVAEGKLNLSNITSSQNSKPLEQPVKLSGEWQFFPYQLLTPTDYLSIQSRQPVTATVPSTWNSLMTESNSPGEGHGTYLLEINGSPTNVPSGLLLQPVCGASKVYFFSPAQLTANLLSNNSNPIPDVAHLGETGTSIATNSFSRAPQLISLPSLADSRQVLMVQVSNYAHSTGGLCQDVILGSINDLYSYHNQKLLFEGIVIAVIFSIALYAFGMFFHYHTNPANMWLGLWALTATFFFWTRANFWEIGFSNVIPISHAFHYKFEYIAMALLGPSGINFYRYTFNSHHVSKSVLRANLVIAGLMIATILLTTVHWFSQNLWMLFSFIGLEIGLIVYIMARAVIDKKPEAAMLFVSVVPMFVTVPLDFAMRAEVIQGEYLSQYAWLFFMFMHCLTQSRRLSSAIDYTARISQTLAHEVEKQTESLEEKNRQLLMVQKELQRANRELQALSITDGLTGTNNRLYFDRQYQVEWQRSRREQEPFSLILLDIDHFKQVNDQYGHLAGDQCLKSVANWLKLTFKRSNDVVCRYGGEEFAILLPNTAAPQAIVAAEQIRQLVADTPVKYLDKEIYLSISAGVSGTVPQKDMQPSDLLRAADNALYSVKHNGRNGVHMTTLSADTETVRH